VTHLVKGFVLRGEAKELAKEWREASPELVSLIPSTYKAAFVRGMRISTAKYIEEENDFVTLGGGDTLDVDLIIGYEDAPIGKVRFSVPEPTETERIKFSDQAMKYLQGRGRKRSARLVTNLRVCVEFFDQLMQRGGARIEGGAVGGQEFSKASSPLSIKTFIEQINPIYKTKVVNAMMSKYNAKLQD
jgi:hypothetical protein